MVGIALAVVDKDGDTVNNYFELMHVDLVVVADVVLGALEHVEFFAEGYVVLIEQVHAKVEPQDVGPAVAGTGGNSGMLVVL